MGLNIRLNYQGFDLAMPLQGSVAGGGQLFNGVKAYEQFPSRAGCTNVTTKALERFLLLEGTQ